MVLRTNASYTGAVTELSPHAPDSLVLPDSLVVMDSLVLASFTVMGRLSEAAAAHDLSLTQLRVLAILRDRHPKMAELAVFLGLDRSSVSGLIDRAVGRGLVRRDGTADDGRAVRVSLTPQGRELARQMIDEIAGVIVPLINRLGAADQKRLGVLLDRLVE